jgi:hypothetical protein
MSTNAAETIPDRVRREKEPESWTDEELRAVEALFDARPGDMVVWGNRSVAMEVVDVRRTSDGREIDVAKPQAEGTYTVCERWQKGKPKFSSGIGRANNLRIAERSQRSRGLTEPEFEDLVERLVENAVDTFMRLDYEDWSSAVAGVVETWADDVALRQWRGYPNHPDWQDGDPEAIFESVIEHGTEYATEDDAEEVGLSTREKAEVVLHDRVLARGRERAESTIVQSEADYDDLIDTLAHHTVDRIERKNYADARVATRDTISDWVDDRTEPVYQAIIEYGDNPFEDDLYADDTDENEARERAFDILDTAVWEEVQYLQRDRGEHDPTLRGMTKETYDETVDYLAGQTLRRWGGDGFLRTTAKDVVEEWADRVQAQQWQGHRHDIYAAGDVADIFASASIHSDAQPFVWNPFARDKERRLAEQAMLADVVSQAEDTYDETQPESDPIPADEYLDDVLEVDTTYDELKEAQPEEVGKVAARIVDATTGDEVGWTFVDEIIEAGGTVIEHTNNWVLVDYGVLREGDQLRKLAWFDRGTGNVLVLSGKATAPPQQLDEQEEPYENFHVTHHPHQASEPEFICESVALGEGLECVYDYVNSNEADIRVIETQDEDWIQEQISEEDLNASGVIDSLVPNLPWGSGDVLTLADAKARGLGMFASRDFAPELARLAGYTVTAVAPRWLGDRLDGVRIEPNIHEHHGVGTKVSKEFGKAPYESGVGGRATVDINVRPGTFSDLSEKYAPDKLNRFAQYGAEEGDLGKGALRQAGEGVERIREDEQGRWLVDTYGQSITSFLSVIRSGETAGQQEQLKREFLADFYEIPEEEVDVDEQWADLSSEVRQGYYEDVLDDVEFSWDEFEQQDLGISGMLMRGLDAESLVGTAEFFDIDDWIEQEFTYYGSDLVEGGDPPTFEEWMAERYGPGKPAGPEQEARMRARFHKEVAAADLDAADPYEALGIDEQMVEEQSDWDQAEYDFDDTFGETFDDVAERTAEIEDEMAAQEFERSVDRVDES